MRKIIILKLSNGRYSLSSKSNLLFTIDNENTLELPKKAALEIMQTLLDSENLLTKEAENLIECLEEKIEQ
jgi:hypothetical protein